MTLVRLIRADVCKVGAGTFVEHDGLELAVFLLPDDTVHVIDNSCPHASGNLSGGEMNDGIVSCPWHFWEFDLTTGICVDSPQACVGRYEAEIRDGWVMADLNRRDG